MGSLLQAGSTNAFILAVDANVCDVVVVVEHAGKGRFEGSYFLDIMGTIEGWAPPLEPLDSVGMRVLVIHGFS